jgi:putative membrane protein
MKQIYCTATALIILFISCTKHKENNDLNEIDYKFLQQTSVYTEVEIAAGQLALSKSANSSVKNFAQTVVAGYTSARAELEDQASYLDVALPDFLDTRGKSLVESLSSLSGYQFDTAYIYGRVRAHRLMLSGFQNTFNNGNNASVKGYVDRYIDMVRLNYIQADSIARKL